MKRSVPQVAGIALLAAAGLLASCASRKEPAFENSLKVPRQYLAVGDFERAIDFFHSAYLRYPDEARVRNEYIGALGKMRSDADRAFQAGDCSAAEKIYLLLQKNYPRFKKLGEGIPFRTQYLEQRIQECRKALAEKRARQLFQAGDFQGMLQAFRIPGADGIEDPDLRTSYLNALEEVVRKADAAMSGEDLKTAGKGYAALLGEYSFAQKIGQPPSFSLKSVQERLDSCRNQLTRQGLEEYRKGNLQGAIALWQGLLEFDPGNAEIQKAVETAREQLRKLKKDETDKK